MLRADQTHVRLAVTSTGGSAEQARARSAERTNHLVASLHELLGPDAEIRTAGYFLSQTYSGTYSAKHTIEVRVQDPAVTGKVIDVAAKSGANTIDDLESASLDEQNARRRALEEAALQAKANAAAIADALGLRMVRIISAETSASCVSVPMLAANIPTFRAKRSAATPLESSPVRIRAQVVVTVEVAP